MSTQTTSNMGSDAKKSNTRNSIMSGNQMVHNYKDFSNFGFWLNGVDVTQQNLDYFVPYIQGISRIFVHHAPFFMNHLYKNATKRWISYIESGYTKIDGIGDLEASFQEFEGGFNAQKFSNVSMVQDTTTNLTISVYELSGSMIREYMEAWMNGARDKMSGVATYGQHSLQAATMGGSGWNETVPYGEKNHTAEFIYNTMDPTAQWLEYCCLWAHAFPTKSSRAHLNYEKGERGNVQMDLEFNANLYESPAINDIGGWYLINSNINYNYLDFTPMSDGKGGFKTMTEGMTDSGVTSSNYNLNRDPA